MGRILLGLSVAIFCALLCGCGPTPDSSEQTDSKGRPLPVNVTNDAELLVYRCGTPDEILDSSNDDPRPPIPARILTYRKAHLKFAYVPDAAMGTPPPYHWKLFGVIDTRTNKAVSADDLQGTLQQRLPCVLTNPK